MGRTVWANTIDVPAVVCEDARLQVAGRPTTSLQYPAGTTHGQAGWDVGLTFKDLDDLAVQLANRFQRGEITRLAINTHGVSGEFFPAGTKMPHQKVTAETVPRFHKPLHHIGLRTSEDATILIAGCLAGGFDAGTRLLKALSQVWPGRKVVGFTTLGYGWPGAQGRDNVCTEPGMRDTDEHHPALTPAQEASIQKLWYDLRKLPWASDDSPHAKVVRDGKVLKTPPEVEFIPPPKRPVEQNKQLYEKWKKWRDLQKKAGNDPKYRSQLYELQVDYMKTKRAFEARDKVSYVDPK